MSSNRKSLSKITSFCLSRDEDEVARKAAEARGMGLSTFARTATLKAAHLRVPIPKRRCRPGDETLARLLGEMGRIGGLMKLLTLQAKDGKVDAAAVEAVRHRMGDASESGAGRTGRTEGAGRLIPSQVTIGTVTHGRTRRSTRNLLAHLYKVVGQTVRVVAIENVPGRSAEEALRVMELMRDGSKKAEIALHHITINPLQRLTEEQRDQAVQRILHAFSAEEHPWVLWEHDGKKRAIADAAEHHFHLVLGHIGPDLKALDVRGSYTQLEAVARSLEMDWGVEMLTPTGRHKAVAAAARKQRREDVAQIVSAMMPKDSEDLPRPTMSSRTRARTARHGINLPRERVRIAEAYRIADTGKAARAAIAALGFSLIKGEEENVWLVMKGDILLGALDRLVHAKRKEVAARLDGIRHDDQADVSPTADAPIEQAASDQTGLDHNRGDLESRHSQLDLPPNVWTPG